MTKHKILPFGKILIALIILSGTILFLDVTHATPVAFLVKDIHPDDDSSPTELVAGEEILFFAATDPLHGVELWKSDGTQKGTIRIKDIYKGLNSSTPSNLTLLDDLLFFTAADADRGRELWTSDGTPAGTKIVKDINAQGLGDDSYPLNLIVVGGTLFFTADDGLTGRELWTSDGTPAGTVLVKDINPTGSANPTNLVGVGGELFFTADDGLTGRELWTSDGTPAGTVLVKDINPAGNATPTNLIAAADNLFFTANDGTHGRELWTSDGTAAGTGLVKDINPTGNANPLNLVALGEELFFTANGGMDGYELWTSDGTESGTTQVKDIRPGSASSGPAHLTVVQGVLFFQANDETHGRELWKSDGTPAGTILVKDINPAGNNATPINLVNMDGALFFTAEDESAGRELWTSDGTPEGTIRLSDIHPGKSSSVPANLTTLRSLIFVTAQDADHGVELWALAKPALSLASATDVDIAQIDQNVTYTYAITNTGNIGLNNIILYDDKLGQIDLDQTGLAAGQSATGTKTYRPSKNDLPGPVINRAVVTGTFASDLKVVAAITESVLLNISAPPPASLYLPLLYKGESIITPKPTPTFKKGLAAVSAPSCEDLAALDAHWYMNWRHLPDSTCEPEQADKFVPRIYDAKALPTLPQIIETARPSGWLIGFNEPNLPWHANMSPAEGAQAWKQIEAAADAAGIKLVSPSPNQWEPNRDGLPYGHQWIWAMVDEYQALYGSKPRFDAIAWHIYTRTPEEAKHYLSTRHNEMLARGYDVPVWVLEYGGECWNTNSRTGNQVVMTELTAWFEATPWIGRYAWFANRLDPATPGAENYQNCSLIDPQTGQLTPLGELYGRF